MTAARAPAGTIAGRSAPIAPTAANAHRLHPDIDTVLFTSHRDGSNAAGCVSELVALSGTWKPFSCPAHPRLRRNGGPCTCKIPQAIKCRGFKGCTPAWMNSHKYVC